jgi:dTDP-4-amino-4,6-dideoxygalactose transaminase
VILRVKLRRLDAANAARRDRAAQLTEALAGLPIELPAVPAGGDHVFHLYVVQLEARASFRAALAADGVTTALHYAAPIHRTPAYSRSGRAGPLAEVERRAERICSLPFWPSMHDAELDSLIRAVHRNAGS